MLARELGRESRVDVRAEIVAQPDGNRMSAVPTDEQRKMMLAARDRLLQPGKPRTLECNPVRERCPEMPALVHGDCDPPGGGGQLRRPPPVEPGRRLSGLRRQRRVHTE